MIHKPEAQAKVIPRLVKACRFLRVLVLVGLVLAGPALPGFAQLFSGWSGGAAKPLVIDFLDIGQGDSILIRSPEGKTALVDAGPSRDAAAKLLKRKVSPRWTSSSSRTTIATTTEAWIRSSATSSPSTSWPPARRIRPRTI